MAVVHIPDWILREVHNHRHILLAFLLGLFVNRWHTREAKNVVRFQLAYPQVRPPHLHSLRAPSTLTSNA